MYREALISRIGNFYSIKEIEINIGYIRIYMHSTALLDILKSILILYKQHGIMVRNVKIRAPLNSIDKNINSHS